MGAEAATAGVIAASAASYLAERSAAKTERISAESGIELREASQSFELARKEAATAQQYRKAIAQQIATAAYKGGSGSLVRQFSAESYSNFLKDMGAFERGRRGVTLEAKRMRAALSSRKFLQDVTSFTRAATTSLNAINLNDNRKATQLLAGK